MAYNESSIRLLLSEEAARMKVKRSDKKFYVYLIYGGTMGVIYIGKGTRNRFQHHAYLARKFLEANPNLPYTEWILSGEVRTKSKVERLAAHLSYAPLRYDFALFTNNEQRAWDREVELIRLHGIATENRGSLSNKAIGGKSGGPGKGHVFSKERRENISRALTGKKLSEAHRQRISDALKGRTIPRDVVDRMTKARPKTCSEQHKKNVSAGRYASKNIKRVRISIHGTVYASMQEAADQSGLTYNVINYALRSGRPGFIRL